MLAHIFKECLYICIWIYTYIFVYVYMCVCVCIYVCILDNDVKDISDDVEKNTIIRSDQRFKR